MDFTLIIKHFQDINGVMIRNLTDTSIHMIYYMIMIDITLTFLFVEEEGMNIFIKLIKKILLYGFFIYIIKNFPEIVDKILHGFIQLGNLATSTAGGIPSKELLVSPGEMFMDLLGTITSLLALSSPVVALDAIPAVSIESIPTAVLIFVFLLAIGALFIGIEITIIFIKFFIVTGVAIILMPFGAFQKTQDIAIKGLHALFAQGTEIMFVTIILNFYRKYKLEVFFLPEPSENIQLLGLIENFGIMLLFCLMVTKIPTFVSTLLSGSISSLGLTNSRTTQNLARYAGAAAKTVNFGNTMSSYAQNTGGVNNAKGIEHSTHNNIGYR